MTATNYDAIVIGTGQAGSLRREPPRAFRHDRRHRRARHFGGTCVNTGCIPTKTMVASAYAAHMARRAARVRRRRRGSIAVDMQRVKARKDEISGQSRTGVEAVAAKSLERCTVYQGHARFESADESSASDRSA